MSTLTATVLGCGASPGVPRIGNDWGQCDPSDPRNRRSRCSLLLRQIGDGGGSTTVLVDTSPDMRGQLLAADVRSLDAVLYTHAHADHLHGIDDLRAFWMMTKRRVPVHADAETGARILEAFGYCFATPAGGNYPPILTMHRIDPYEPIRIDGAGGTIEILPFRQAHGAIATLGFKIRGLAYSCDVSGLDEIAQATIEDADVWIVDALRREPHPSHFSLSESIAWIERLRVRRGILTHMDYSLDYETVRRMLPEHIVPAHDGMAIELPAELPA